MSNDTTQGIIPEIIEVGKEALEYVTTSKDNVQAAVAWAGGIRVRTIYLQDVVSTRVKKDVKRGEYQTTAETYEDIIFNVGDILAKDESGTLHVIKPALFSIITSSVPEKEVQEERHFPSESELPPKAPDTTISSIPNE